MVENVRLPMVCVCDDGRREGADMVYADYRATHHPKSPYSFLTSMAYDLDTYHAWIHDVMVDQWCGVSVRQLLYPRTPDGHIDDSEDAPEPTMRQFYIECDRLEDGLIEVLAVLVERHADPEDLG
jgi:hypothetical protein